MWSACTSQVRLTLRNDCLRSRPTLTVLPGPTSAAASTADGEGLVSAVAGSRASFTIVARDQFGNARDCEDDQFEVAIRPARAEDEVFDFTGTGGYQTAGQQSGRLPSLAAEDGCEEEAAVTGDVIRQADGTAAAVLVPRTSGPGYVEVTLGGRHIAGSPFVTSVAGGAPEAAYSTVSGTAHLTSLSLPPV